MTILWSSIPIDNETVIDSTNNELNISYNDEVFNLNVEESGYMMRISTHESRLVDKINELLEANSIDVKCLLGIQANGIEKEAYVVFEVDEDDTFEISGSFADLIGEVI